MKKLIQLFLSLWISFFAHQAFAELDSLQRMKIRKEIESLMDKQKAQNLENDRLGKSHLNNYIIDYQKILDDDETEHFKIKEANGGKTLWNLESDAFKKEKTGIKAILSSLNAGRSQNDKIYVVLISIYDYKRDVIRWYQNKNRYTQDYEAIDNISGQNWSAVNNALTQKVQNQSQINAQSNGIDNETFRKNNLVGDFVGTIMKQKIGSGNFSNKSIACFSHYQIVFDKNGNSTYKVNSSILRFTSIPKALLDLIDVAADKFDLQGAGRNDALRDIVSILADYENCSPDATKYNAEVQRISSFLDTELDKLSSNTQSGVFITPKTNSDFNFWGNTISLSGFTETQKKISHLEEKTGYKICVIVDNSKELICDDLIAKSVFLKSQKLDKSKTILIYARLTTKKFDAQPMSIFYSARLGHYVPTEIGAYIETSDIEMAHSKNLYKDSDVGGFSELIIRYVHNNIYRPLPKPTVIYNYHINQKGDLIQYPTQISSSATGLDMYNLVVTEDRRLQQLKKCIEIWFVFEEHRNQAIKDIEKIINSVPTEKDIKFYEHGIKESVLAVMESSTNGTKYNKVADDFARWRLKLALEGIEAYLPDMVSGNGINGITFDYDKFHQQFRNAPPDNVFITGKNEQVFRDNLETLDILGLALSPIGGDFVTDGIGAIYCFIHGEIGEGFLYTGAVFVPILLDAPVKAGKGYKIVSKTTTDAEVSALLRGRTYITINSTQLKDFALGNIIFNSPELSLYGLKGIDGIAFRNNDNFVDVIIHSEGNGYVIWIDKKRQVVTESTLAKIIYDNVPDGKTIRLLSCSDLQSAKALSSKLNNRKVIASEGVVKLYHDGSVLSTKWYEVNGDNAIVINNPTPITSNTNTSLFVKLGNLTKQQKAQYKSFLLSPDRQAAVLNGDIHTFRNATEQAEFDNLEKLGDPFEKGKESDNFYLDGLDPKTQQIYINLRDEYQRFFIADKGQEYPYKNTKERLEATIRDGSKETHIIDLLYYSKTNATTYASGLNNLKAAFPTIESIVSSKATNPYIFAVNGDNTKVYLGEIGLTHILGRHHPQYFLGGEKNKVNQTYFNENMSINDIVQKLDECVNYLRSNLSTDDIGKFNKLLTGSGVTKQISFVINLNGHDYTVGIKKSIKGDLEIRQFFPGK